MTSTVASVPADKAAFVARYGSIFRNGAWIAERAFDANSDLLASDDILAALTAQFRAGSLSEQHAILRGYSELNGRVAKARIVDDPADSFSLDAMTTAQKSRLLELLVAYLQKFGFDVIFAVRDYTTATLLAVLEERMANDDAAELTVNCREIERLAQLQMELLPTA